MLFQGTCLGFENFYLGSSIAGWQFDSAVNILQFIRFLKLCLMFFSIREPPLACLCSRPSLIFLCLRLQSLKKVPGCAQPLALRALPVLASVLATVSIFLSMVILRTKVVLEMRLILVGW